MAQKLKEVSLKKAFLANFLFFFYKYTLDLLLQTIQDKIEQLLLEWFCQCIKCDICNFCYLWDDILRVYVLCQQKYDIPTSLLLWDI